jgi:DnaJ-class molecular chaperone
MTPETPAEPPAKTPPESCRKCGGTGHKNVPDTIRALFSDLNFECDRCRGTKIEPPSH